MCDYQESFEGVPIYFWGDIGYMDGKLHIKGKFQNLWIYPNRNSKMEVIPNSSYICNFKTIPGNSYCFAEIVAPMTDEEVLKYITDHPEKSNGLISWIIKNREKMENTEHENETSTITGAEMSDESIFRIGFNELKSDLFADDKYTVRYSPNGRRMLITPNKNGRTECRNGVITIPGMEKRRPFVKTEKVRFTRDDSGFSLVFA